LKRHLSGVLLLVALLAIGSPAFASLKFTPGGQVGGASSMPYIGTSWTIAFWMKLNSFATEEAFVVRDNSAGSQTQIWIEDRGNTSDKIVAICGGADAITSTATFTSSTWHHIAVTQSAANSWTLYVDGVQDATSSTSCTPNSTANQVRFGKHISNNKQLDGDMAEVAIWSTPLSAAEIAALAKGVPPNWFRMGNMLLYTPLYGRTTSGATTTEVQADLSGQEAANGTMVVNTSTGDVTTDGHCPCSPPAGSYAH
jgi:Concanavalin A-like lectin/glucanases superfamily